MLMWRMNSLASKSLISPIPPRHLSQEHTIQQALPGTFLFLGIMLIFTTAVQAFKLLTFPPLLLPYLWEHIIHQAPHLMSLFRAAMPTLLIGPRVFRS